MRVAALLVFAVTIACAQASIGDQGLPNETRAYWVDTSGLMWARRDNGKDVSWQKAMKYCRDLRLAGYSDWRLATIYELQDIYDANLESPGLAGFGRAMTWHVKGNLFLTGVEWSSSRNHDDRGRPYGSAPRFNFNDGKRFYDFLGYSTGKRALCVRKVGS